jgi:hypothetical protein
MRWWIVVAAFAAACASKPEMGGNAANDEIRRIRWTLESTGLTSFTQEVVIDRDGSVSVTNTTMIDPVSRKVAQTSKKTHRISGSAFAELADLVNKSQFFSASRNYWTTCKDGPDVLSQPGVDTVTIQVWAGSWWRGKAHSTSATYGHLGDEGGFPPAIEELSRKIGEIVSQRE